MLLACGFEPYESKHEKNIVGWSTVKHKLARASQMNVNTCEISIIISYINCL